MYFHLKKIINLLYLHSESSGGTKTSYKKEGSIAFSPENPLTRAVTEKAMTTVAEDNLGMLALMLGADVIPSPEGYKNGKEMEMALNQPEKMNRILTGIEFDERMASK